MKKIAFIMVSLLAAAACNDMITPENTPAAGEEGITYFVSTMEGNDVEVEEDDTKTALQPSNQYRVFWEETDYISIYDGTTAHQYKATPCKDENGNYTTAHFYPVQTGLVLPAGQKYYALYPHDENAEWDGSEVTFTIPETQTAVIDNFAYNASVAVSDNDNHLKFYNVGALVQFKMNTSLVRTVVLEAVGGEPLVGKVTMDCADPDGQESLSVVEGSSQLYINGTGSASNFYVTILPGAFSKGIKITVLKESDGSYQSAKTESFKLSRSKRISLGTFQFSSGSTQGFQGAYQGPAVNENQKMADNNVPGGYYYRLDCGIDVAGANISETDNAVWNDVCLKDGMFVNPCPAGWNLPTAAQIDRLVVAADNAIHCPFKQICYWKLNDGSLLDGKELWGKTTFIAMSSEARNDTDVYRYQYKYTSTDNTKSAFWLAENKKSSHKKTDTKTNVIYRCVREAQQ